MDELEPKHEYFIDELEDLVRRHLGEEDEEFCRKCGVSLAYCAIKVFYHNGGKGNPDFEGLLNKVFTSIINRALSNSNYME